MVTRAGGARYRKPRRTIVIPERVAQRAALCAVRDGDCIVSAYSVASHGYAQVGWQEGGERWIVTAHRAAWVHYTRAQIPEGMTIDHLCRNRRCVRREHLRMLSNFENARRTAGRDWPLGQCVNGHPNSELRTTPSGKQVCASCQRAWTARHNRKRRDAA